jgi:UDP-2,3-diacylglucosamine pyrophosphatase LpxH
MKKRNPEVVIISDAHLGTYGSHAAELNQYLSEIHPKILVLNGDIIDIWNFKKRFFPASHSEVVRRLLKLASQGVRIFYIPGNHDEALRKYTGFKLGNIKIVDKLILELDGRKHWIFHGDVFDASTKGSARLLARLGGKGYDLLIWFNHQVNRVLTFFGREKMSFSKRIKASVKRAVSWVNNFEETAIELAIRDQYDFVICGHIHQPQQRTETRKGGTTTYLNSGDWVENLTSLEYEDKQWRIHHHQVERQPAHSRKPSGYVPKAIPENLQLTDLSIPEWLVSPKF